MSADKRRTSAARKAKGSRGAGAVELEPEQLYRTADLSKLKFETTDDLKDFKGVLGQPRAVESVHFGVGIEAEGYNVFALGPAGTGKHSLLAEFFKGKSREKPVPPDWCYVHNFKQSHKPRAIQFPAGRGMAFSEDMEALIEDLKGALETSFESEEYHSQRQKIQEEVQQEQEKSLDGLRERAEEEGFTLLRTPAGLGFAPVRDGEVVDPDKYQNLGKEEREEIEAKVTDLQSELQRIMRQMPRLQREAQEQLRGLNREFAHLAAGGLLTELREKHSDLDEVMEYLDEVEEDILENVQDFLPKDDSGQDAQRQAMFQFLGGVEQAGLRRYKVNVIVDHSESEHGPVEDEDNPTYANLIGRVEHVPQMGALLTDFNLIKAGALHSANGGFLLLDARTVLLQPFAWEGLKRALRAQEIRIESPGQAYGLLATTSLEPEPIPLDVKVALVGDRMLYYLLDGLDPEFGQLFKVMADFGESMDWDGNSQKSYARLIARLVRKESLRPFSKEAVARVLERSARMAGDQQKMSTRMRIEPIGYGNARRKRSCARPS
jgi:hypothetical protein